MEITEIMEIEVGDYLECIVDTLKTIGFRNSTMYMVVKIVKLDDDEYANFFIRNDDGINKNHILASDLDSCFRVINRVKQFDDAMGVLK